MALESENGIKRFNYNLEYVVSSSGVSSQQSCVLEV